MELDRYSAPVSRGVTLILGLVVGVIGVALAFAGGVGIYGVLKRPATTEVKVVLGVALAIGLALSFIGFRLVAGKRRSDGGLFSPWVLRIGGMFFLCAPVFMFLARQSTFGILETVTLLSAGVACFAVANHRERRDS
jgi:hypothetical protein